MENDKNILDQLRAREIKTPDQSYFKEIARNVIESQNTKIIPIYRRPIFWISSAAAAVVISLVLINIGNNPIDVNDVMLSMNDVSDAEILTYVDEHIDEFDTEMICDVIHEDSLKLVDVVPIEVTTNETSEILETESTIDFDNINSEDILNYLEDQGIGVDDLEDESIYLNL